MGVFLSLFHKYVLMVIVGLGFRLGFGILEEEE